MINDHRQHNRLPDVVKKVIAFMTLGIDVSDLFSEMSMLSFTKDIVTKKLIFLFLTTYAENNSDKALMAVNSFAKDLDSTNPKIKGLALRGLCSLRFDGMVEMTAPHVIKKLDDNDPYVKKVAINCCVKLFYIEKKFATDNNISSKLYTLLKDSKQMVILSAINALHEIMSEDGGMAVNYNIVYYLINRIKEFDEFGQAIVLDLASKLEPESEDEMYSIMNIVAELLKASSPCVILGAAKIFLKYIEYED